MRIDVMVDIETLGNKIDSTIFQISAIAFDIKSGEYISTFDRIADIIQNKKLNVTGDTFVWWLHTNKELLTELLSKGKGSSGDILKDFFIWLQDLSAKGEIYLWGNGILFDNSMIKYQLEKLGLKYPIYYKNDRDVRTIVDLTCTKLGISEKELKERFYDKNRVEHNALDDVKFQIELVSWCYRELVENSHAVTA